MAPAFEKWHDHAVSEQEQSGQSPDAQTTVPPAKILIIDDVPQHLQVLVEALQRAGYRIQVATNGRDGLAIAASAPPPNLILLDVAMPELDGFEVCRRLKSDDRTKTIPVLFISGSDVPEMKVRGFQVGGVDFITKPFPLEEVVARVRTHLKLARFEELDHEIEERRLTETALRNSESTLAWAQRIAHVGSWQWNISKQRIVCSEEMLRIFGRRQEDFEVDISILIPRIIHPEDQERMHLWTLEIAGSTEPSPLQVRIVRPDGTIRTLWAEAGALDCGTDGRPAIVRGIAQDITDHVAAEEESRRLQHELQTAQKLDSIGRLAGGVAHDFNNMLLVIQGHTEMAMSRLPEGSPLMADLETIHTATRKSADLTRQLLAFARQEPTKPRVVDLNDSIEAFLKMLRRLIGDDIRLAWQPRHDLWKVRIDPVQVDQILANLCLNARDAIEGSGRISIETSNLPARSGGASRSPGIPPGDYVTISVKDDGKGMDADTASRALEPFFTTKEEGKGTGLGLSTVYGAVKQNAGFVKIESTPGTGTTFTIFLPRETDSKPGPEAPREDGRSGSGHEAILVVEDDPTILAMLRSILEFHGYRVFPAKGPLEALHIVESLGEHLDLLVTDVVMPEMNGNQLLRSLVETRPDLKHLFMSGHSPTSLVAQGYLESGANFLQKPFSVQDVTTRIRQALEGGSDSSAPPPG